VLTYFAVRLSGKPADKEHQFGHGKVESVSALVETGLLFLLTAIVVWEAAQRLISAQAHAVEATAAAFAVIAGSIVVDFFRARTLQRVARETSSEALEADALHFSSDMWSSVAVLIGLGGVAMGYPWADATAAIIVAVFIAIAGFRLGKRTVGTLTDTAPEGVSDLVSTIARQVPGVVAVERVRVRPAGPTLFVELGVGISRTLPLDRVSAIKDRLTRDVRAELPSAEVTITTEPRVLDNETVRERVMMIARNRGLAIHHVAVQTISGRLAVSLDLEVEGAMVLATAHDVASQLEQAVSDELGSGVEVETHIEPLPADVMAGRDAPDARIREVRDALVTLAREIPDVGEVHDVRVRDTAEGEIVNFHCRVDPALAVGKVHDAVDALESRLRRQFPKIQRVIGHAEPRTEPRQ
jgi:cation diffusion facilitator family transporter